MLFLSVACRAGTGESVQINYARSYHEKNYVIIFSYKYLKTGSGCLENIRDLKPLKAKVICFPKIRWIFKYKLSQKSLVFLKDESVIHSFCFSQRILTQNTEVSLVLVLWFVFFFFPTRLQGTLHILPL